MSDNIRGALIMMAAMMCFTLNDTLTKTLAGALPPHQVLVMRNGLTTLVLLAVSLHLGHFRLKLPRRDRGLILARGLAEAASAYFFLNALFHLPLANVTAVVQSLPLAVTLAAAVFLKEPVGWRRASAIAVGFVGVLLILRPGPEGFSLYSFYSLMAVLVVTLRELFTRQVADDVPSMLITTVTSATVFISALLYGGAVGGWVAPTAGQWATVGAAAAIILVAYLASVVAMRVGEVSFVSPFRYVSLLWALLLGWLVFGDWPGPVTLLGGAIVIGSGLFMIWREQRIARRSVATEAAAETAGSGRGLK
ncbi:DMT family transporter [Maritimibacter alkaliphilus]|uniref:DMT family transporter n=1 Tax=Maritimibacter alkaliphilus TaxID=404236 RepID=UPI001C945D1C|nr:DMT family transporter [Maritimibacter alkaliphilus]MBY6091427.1 DMT family transporter [Maritimibacter alkaliphilus]